MRKSTIDEKKRCPKCGRIEKQVKAGFNASGTQRCRLKICGIWYTLEPKATLIRRKLRKQLLKHTIPV